jgi:hypothetical protein
MENPAQTPTSITELVLTELDARLRAREEFTDELVDEILSILRSGPRRLGTRLESALAPEESTENEAN